MDMSLIEKFRLVFKYMFSSFLSVEMLILSLLLLCILLFNLKLNNKYINIAAICIYLGFILGIVVTYVDYVKLCIDSFIKTIMGYVYFPSTFVYFLIFIFITGLMIYTIFNKKIKPLKKIVNYSCFSILYFLFMSFIVLTIYMNVDIYDTALLYQNEIILAIVQVSNLIFGIWILFTGFYELYNLFKKRFDKKGD